MDKQAQALVVIRSGGWIRHALETGYRGREQFAYRLFDASGNRVAGFGYASLYPLTESRAVTRDWQAIYGTTAQRIYRAA